jgi:nicotinate-nucleotide adenylyltransferase
VSRKKSRQTLRGRRVGLFGGTFDPIHLGHLAVARAAQRRFHLDHVFFIPAGCPPHKTESDLSPFVHRFAMTTLACAGYPRFVPSLAEAGPDGQGRRICYSVDTVRRFRKQFRGRGDHLYFLLGADSFLHFATWKNYEALLGLCDFVIASRPGFPSDALRRVIPAHLFSPQSKSTRRQSGAIELRQTTVYLLDTVASHVSATRVRERLDRGQSVRGLVPSSVEDYIIKQALYK